MDDYLTRMGTELPSEQHDEIANQVMRVLEDERFSPLYGPGSRAEVPIVGRLELNDELIRVNRRVDRLAVTQTAVLIGDFKSDRPVPRRIEQVSPAYIRQLAEYRALLTRIYPGRPVRAALIWTEVPDLMELSAEALDAALTRVTAA